MKKNTLKRFMASAMTAVMCVSSLGTLAVNAAPADPAAETSVVDNLMSKMTLRQKIAQMMMPDFRKWQTESDSGQKNFQVMNDEVAQIIKDYDFGGVILFAENVAQTDQTLKLTTDLQEAATGGTDGSNIPLLLTIDQEGGIVYRLGSGTALPGNMALGATRSTDAATQSGEVIGRELRAAKSLQKKLMALPNVEIIWDTVVNEICGEDQVEALFIENKKTGAKKHLPVDGVFVAVGMKPNTNMVPDEIKKDEAGYIVADENCVTNVTGIFAAGDVRTKMLRQIITAAADGANAVESVQHGI